MDPNKRRKRGDGEERERKKKTSTPHPVPGKNHRVDDMFKAAAAKKAVATTSGSNTSAGASVGESSVRSEELAGGSNTSAGASVGESSVRSEELAGGSNTSAGASVGESSVRSEELAGRTLLTSATNQPLLPKTDASEMKKEETDQCIKEEKGHHDSHSFAYSIGKESEREITCSAPQTVLDALMTSSSFEHEHNAKTVKDEELKEVKHKEPKKIINKELVILRDKKAISSHFPCWLIGKKYPLDILYINAKGNSESPKSVVCSPQRKAVIFHVKTEGAENIKYNILNNINLKAKADEVSVYAFEGETVEFALERDGRFKNDVFSTCALKNVSNDRITEMSNLVNNLGGKTFKVIRDDKYAALKRRSKPEPVPCASTSTNYSTRASTSTSSPQSSSKHVAVNTDKAEQTAKLNTSTTLAKPFPIPDYKATLDLLRSQFKGLVKHMKGRQLTVAKRQEFRVEYGKNDESCNTVKMQRQLMVRADSVCQVRVEGNAKGSGFLLFDKYILTNAHVIKDFYNGQQLTQNVTVSFCYEDVQSPVDSDHSVPVKPEVVFFHYELYDTGFYYDWALLELDSGLAKNIPCGLLEHFATPPQSRGGICIIGHPDGGVKRTDICHTIPGDESETVALDRYKAVQHLVTKLYFGPFEAARLKNERTDVSYTSANGFYYGSSGSPVFNEFCNVVAMHTGGYVYETEARKGQTQSFIEYAQPLSRILPITILRIVEGQRFDVLEAYLQYTSDHPKRKATWDQLKEEVVRIGNMEKDPTIVKEFLERYDRHNQSEDMDIDEIP